MRDNLENKKNKKPENEKNKNDLNNNFSLDSNRKYLKQKRNSKKFKRGKSN